MEWKEEYNIGVEVVDRAHRQLFSIVRRIASLLGGGDPEKSRFACQEGIKYLKSYVVKHFGEEEAHMLSIGYKGYERHRAIHENLKHQTLPILERELEQSGYSDEAVRRFLGVCIGWLTAHIMNEDQAIAGKGVGPLPQLRDGAELFAMESLIPRLIRQTFGLEAVLLNRGYGGWDMGDALYYELLYASPKGERLRSVLVLEKQLALATTGQMAGLRFAGVDGTVLAACMELTQDFLRQIGDLIGLDSFYCLEGDRLLDRESFHARYDAQPPQYSLLFFTRQGRFAFCFDRLH